MSRTFEADVALIHIAAGSLRVTPPPGSLAQIPPRRPARGRAEDLYFVTLATGAGQPVTAGLVDHLAHLAARNFYATPGAITTALREAASEVNDHIVNLARSSGDTIDGSLVQGVLRGRDLYLAQCGQGQALLVRAGQSTRLTSSEAERKPLGQTAAPFVGFHHVEVAPDDLVILTASSSLAAWPDSVLSGLSELTPEQALERLGASSSLDMSGVFVRIAAPGQPAAAPMPAGPHPMDDAAGGRRASRRGQRSLARPRSRAAERGPSAMGAAYARFAHRARSAGDAAALLATRWISRLAPGLAEPIRPGMFSPSLLAGTAIAVPVFVVALVSLVYFRSGRQEQFQETLLQAQAAVITAKLEANPQVALVAWDQAADLLTQAARYGDSQDLQILLTEVQTERDKLKLVNRTEFYPAVSGGFGSGARPAALAASTTDLYVLDEGNETVWHTWSTGRGYEIDRDFECYGTAQVTDFVQPIDLALQASPGALGTEGVVLVDIDGTVMYCAPGTSPVVTQLSPPEVGWRAIQAIDVFNDRLYVLDPAANAVWVFDASDGLFSGNPSRFFGETVPDLTNAIDLEMAQDELFVLLADGQLTRCRKNGDSTECEQGMRFEDDRPEFEATDRIPDAQPLGMVYAPPPEPSLYFLDALSGDVYHYSMRLVYQARYVAKPALEGEPSAITFGPPGDLFIAVGPQVYYAQPQR
ncbi:MAG: hypothetical protein MUO23_04760 [Anaerolineales bacterium]|nr:hypothetical protein [Anaerolineales bacterium]